MQTLRSIIILLIGFGSLISCVLTERNKEIVLSSLEIINQDEHIKDFSLYSLDGGQVRLSDYKGEYVVIHIATTWCPYCNAEAPYLEQLQKDYANRNVNVIIIDVKEPAELVRQKLRDPHNLTFPILLDTNGAVAGSMAPKDVLPELARDEVMLASNILIDPEGRIQFLSLLDTRNFDVKLNKLKSKLDELLTAS